MTRTSTLAAAMATCIALPVAAAGPYAAVTDPATSAKTFALPDGTKATIGKDGIGWRSDASGLRGHPMVVLQPTVKSGLGESSPVSDLELQRRLAIPQRGKFAPGRVLVWTNGNSSLDAGLRAVGARRTRAIAGAADNSSRTFVVDVAGDDPVRAAAKLRAIPGVLHAEPDFYVGSMATGARPLPDVASRATPRAAAALAPTSGLPANYGLTSSLQSYLNANGVDAVGAYAEIASRFGQLPGQGIIVTNVSIGDLTDQAMADAGDPYVQFYGPTTRVIGGQRYLDYVSLPLIPTYTVSPDGAVDPLGTVERVDPFLGEVLLDFSVMAPLPHDRQRPDATGAGATDILGIAPGAQYRLVVPQEPTISNILVAMLAAAQQNPRPDVISASLGFGVDSTGFPGRYLEDDPVSQSVISTIVNRYGVVVAISANDGTRLYTNAAVGLDGGSAATDLVPRGGTPTSVADDALSTTPSLVPDTGAMAVGGTTLDDVFSAPPHGVGPLSHNGQFPTTRLNGGGGFSSGFGSRINLSAPSDNIVSLFHACADFICPPFSVIPVLNGGTSASAPMVAAASAVVLQVARLTHQRLTPAQVRDLLIRTARPIPDAPQSTHPFHVGPQLDVTAAVRALLAAAKGGSPHIVRTSVAHRQNVGGLGARFITSTDPSNVDLLGPDDPFNGGLGQNLTGPITFGVDVTGLRADDDNRYALKIGSFEMVSTQPSFRLLPLEILAAAGLPLVSNDARTVQVTLQVRKGQAVLDSATTSLTFSATDGTYSEALAPIAPASIDSPRDIFVAWDLSGVRQVNNPQLVVSSINHFSPDLAPNFRPETTIPLKGLAGVVRVPASAFAAGRGNYGIAVLQDPELNLIGEFAILRVGEAGLVRPPAPTLADAAGVFGHGAAITRSAPRFKLQWDARSVPGADGAILEISAPGPTLFNSINTFTNANGDRRDQNGVDSGSTVFMPLSSVAGVTELDALKLGLPTSLFYGVRILATAKGKTIGEASPSSGLELDDGITPGGLGITDFDVQPNGPSVVALSAFTMFGEPAESALAAYSPQTGTYGAPFVDDLSGNVLHQIVGTDPSARSTAVIEYPWFSGVQNLRVYDPITGAQKASIPVDPASEYYLITGRVDPVRHRAAVLAWNSLDFTDHLLPLDLRTGALAAPIALDVGDDGQFLAAAFTAMDIDRSTGHAVVATEVFGDICVGGRFGGWITSADLDTGAAQSVGRNESKCITGLASDQSGGNAWMTIGPLLSFPQLLPPARMQPFDETSLVPGTLKEIDQRSPFFPVYDPVHHLMVAAFVAGTDFYVNNNAMSGVGAVDTRSGRMVSYSPSFNFVGEAFSGTLVFVGERGIQIDPATRTGWTFGPSGVQIQQFRY